MPPLADTASASYPSTTATPEIKALARALKYDPHLIYEYMHNNIDYVPYFGSLKGANLTYLDGSGNDFDQASLMIALLRESGYTAQFYYGLVQHKLEDIANWLGVDHNMEFVFTMLRNGGIPVLGLDTINGYVAIRTVLVKVNINNTDYLAFPAYKNYEAASKIDFGSALAYNRDDLLLASSSGAAVDNDGIGVDYVQGINEANIKSKMVEYSTNLINTIRSQHPNKSVEEILGRSVIVEGSPSFVTFDPSPGIYLWGDIPSFYAYPVGGSDPGLFLWDEIPSQVNTPTLGQHSLIATVTIDINYQDVLHTFDVPEMAGKRLTVTFNGSGIPELNLDGVTIKIGTVANQTHDCAITIDHPYLTMNLSQGGDITYVDENLFDQSNIESPYKLTSGADYVYAIISDFGGTSNALLLNRQEILSASLAENLVDTSEPVRGESLNLIGLNWMKQINSENQLLDELSDRYSVNHHRMGVVAQHESYYISVDLFYSGNGPNGYDSGNLKAQAKVFFSMGSAFEHGVLEQMKDTGIPAVSTMKIFQVANENNKKIFFANSNNFSSVSGQLLNYTNEEKAKLQTLVTGGHTLILPEDSEIQLGDWAGYAYAQVHETAEGATTIGMIIQSGLFGGFGTSLTDNAINSGFINSYQQENSYNIYSPDTVYNNVLNYTLPLSTDPIDMASGAFVHDHTDLALGGQSPLGLAFSRSYNSNKNLDDIGLGYGWTHNYDIRLDKTSHPDPGLGSRNPVDAAAMIAALYVNLDLMENHDDILGWVTSTLINKWAVDQLTNNAINVHLGSKTMEYIELPDGTYSPPPGITTNLIKNPDETFSLVERFGTRLDFDSQNRVAQLTDVDGNSMSFTYNATSDKLETIQDAFNRTLTLAYNGDQIESVSDSTGRSVSYGYDTDGNLASYIDPELKVWTFGYDTTTVCTDPAIQVSDEFKKHRMTSLTNAAGITTAVNTYDCLGKVDTQTVKRMDAAGALYDVTYNLYFSGYRNIEEDSAFNQRIYYYDKKGRPVAQENALGQKVTKKYDGQNHTIETTDPRGNTTQYIYDGYHNLVKTINSKQEETIYNYDDPLLPVTSITNHLQHKADFHYDAEYHLDWTKTYPSTGVEITTSSTYYSNGLTDTITDGRGYKAKFVPDLYGNPDYTQAINQDGTPRRPAADYVYNAIGQMTDLTDQEGAHTHFVYDDRGLVTTKTDPLLRDTIYQYDDNGNLWQKTDRNNHTLTYTYTPSNKLSTITYPDTSSVKFVYNELDRLESMTDSLGTSNYTEYDNIGRLKSATDPNGFIVQYEYDTAQTENDQAGNLTKIIYPGNKAVTYTYDELNRLKTVKNWLNQTATYVYDPAGRLEKFTNFNGTTIDYTFDDASRLTKLENKAGAAPIATYNFVDLDENGNPRQIKVDEPLAPAVPTGSTTHTYNIPKNRLEAAGTDSFTYDDEGQLDTGYGTDYTFDYEHRLTGVGGNIQYFYDGIGNRLKAVRDGVTIYYVYDMNGNLIAEADETKTIINYYIYGAGLLAMVTPADETYCYHFNATGSTVAMTDMGKTMVNKYAYTPFGTLANKEENIPQPFKFVGQYGVMSESNGFYYMRARHYDPKVRRFISEDPIGFEGGDLNLYAYAGNNPLMYIDPTGLELRIYNRPVDGFIGKIGANHAFLYSTITRENVGMGINSGNENIENLGLQYSVVPNPLSVSEALVMDHLRENKDTGIWFPWINDCHTKIDNSLTFFGLENPGAPGGRLGEIPISSAPTTFDYDYSGYMPQGKWY